MTRLLLPIILGAGLVCLALIDAPTTGDGAEARAQSARTGLCLGGHGGGTVRTGW